MRGRDIKRYGYVDNGLYLINTHNGVRGRIPRIKIEDYPAVKAHLDQYWDRIATRADKGDTPYNLRNCAYLEDFFKPKIVYQELSQGCSFAIDKNGRFFISNTGYLITGEHLDYLLQVLNSPVIEYVYRHFYGTTLGTSGVRWLAQHIHDLPIPLYKDTVEIKKVIDASPNKLLVVVGCLYGLSAEELAMIENQ